MTTPAMDPTDPRTGEPAEPVAGASPAGHGVDAPAAAPGGSGSAAIDRIDELEAKLAERTSDLQRSMADFQNYKRRRDREFESAQQQAVTTFVTGLLPVLDDVDRAREHEEMSAGFRSVADGLTQQVARAGVTRFGEPGDRFDPTVHEALVSGYSEEVDGPTATVIVSAGYRVGDRLVRPARVMVMDRAAGSPTADGTGAADGSDGTAPGEGTPVAGSGVGGTTISGTDVGGPAGGTAPTGPPGA